MRSVIPWLLVSLAPVLAVAREVRAEPAQSRPATAASPSAAVPQPYWLGLSGGVGWAHVNHPNVVTPSFVGATFGMHFGYTVTPKWAIGVDFSTIEKEVDRFGLTRTYGVDSMTKPQVPNDVNCSACPDSLSGGMPASTMLLVGVLGPLVELTPFGPHGFYLGASGGFALVQVAEYYAGVGGTFRTGYRVHTLEIFNLALEAGVRGQYVGGAGVVVYGTAIFRPSFNFKKKGRTYASIQAPISHQ